MADLPLVRIERDFQFATTGVEKFGPFLVRDRQFIRKRYRCLLTCLKLLAVRIEISGALSIFFLKVLRSHQSKGIVKGDVCQSRNALVGVERELKNFSVLLTAT